jgi:hypothetical protein
MTDKHHICDLLNTHYIQQGEDYTCIQSLESVRYVEMT